MTSEPRSILFLDDDTDLMSAYQYALGQEGYRVQCARSVEDAIHAFDDNHFPQVLFVDFRMGKTSGGDALKRLHECIPDLLTRTRVYAFSGLDKSNPLLQTTRPYVHGVVEKPNDLTGLIDLLRSLFESKPHRHILTY